MAVDVQHNNQSQNPTSSIERSRKLNLGCGPVQPSGWCNVDGSNRAWLVSHCNPIDRLLTHWKWLEPSEFGQSTRHVNLLKRFPWNANSIDAIYMGEILEHFTEEQGQLVLKECYRVLRPGGLIRIRVPDNAQFWENYLIEFRDQLARDPIDWDNSHARWIRMFFRDICKRKLFLSSIGHYHKFMYDEVSLNMLLRGTGFHNVDRCAYLESRIADVHAVEMRDGLIVEAEK